MGDITDVYSIVGKIKQTIAKTRSSQSTLSTSFVDVTGSSITVPNNWYYAQIFDYSVNTGTTGTWKFLEGATQKDTGTFAGNGANIKFDPQKIYQNISGSSQAVKMQLKSDGLGSSPTVSIQNLSIITSPNPILMGVPIIQSNSSGTQLAFQRDVIVSIKAYITSMDILIGSDNNSGVYQPELFFNNILPISDNQTTIQTISNINTLVDQLRFMSSYSSGTSTPSTLYIAYDWDGKQIMV